MIEHNYNALQSKQMHKDIKDVLVATNNYDYFMEYKDGSCYIYLSDGNIHKFTIHRGIEL